MIDQLTERIERLEVALAHQQSVIDDLSDELVKQWRTMEGMGRSIKEHGDKIDALGRDDGTPPPTEPPPHY